MTLLKIIVVSLIVSVASSMSGCSLLPHRDPPSIPVTNPMLATECPETLEELNDPSFGATVQLMVKWANQYHNCRKAAMTTKESTK